MRTEIKNSIESFKRCLTFLSIKHPQSGNYEITAGMVEIK